LLIAQLAFADNEDLRAQATVGILLAAVFATLLGWVAFRLAAVLRGETEADLPRFLDTPVDPERDHISGPVDAPLTLVEYGDYECPFCAHATGVLQQLRDRFGDRLRYVYRHLPLPDVHEHSELAARAAVAADKQGRFWDMHDLLFAHREHLEFDDVVGYAGDLGLDIEQFLDDLDDEPTAERVRQDVASAEASGATGAPPFFIGNRRHTGPYDAAPLARELGASDTGAVTSRPPPVSRGASPAPRPAGRGPPGARPAGPHAALEAFRVGGAHLDGHDGDQCGEHGEDRRRDEGGRDPGGEHLVGPGRRQLPGAPEAQLLRRVGLLEEA